MTLDRRKFLKTTLAGSAAVALSGCPSFASARSKADNAAARTVLNLSFQEGTAPGANLNEKFDFMEKHGVTGFEPHGKAMLARLQEMKEALRGRNIKVSAVCAGFDGFILSTDPAIRKQCRDSMAQLIVAAGELGSTGVIIVPAFNNQVPVMPHSQETRDFLCEQFDEMGTLAQKHGTTVILEPLNRKEAFYLRQVGDAASICRDINNPGVKCMGDFWHMTVGGEFRQWVLSSQRENICNMCMWPVASVAACRVKMVKLTIMWMDSTVLRCWGTTSMSALNVAVRVNVTSLCPLR